MITIPPFQIKEVDDDLLQEIELYQNWTSGPAIPVIYFQIPSKPSKAALNVAFKTALTINCHLNIPYWYMKINRSFNYNSKTLQSLILTTVYTLSLCQVLGHIGNNLLQTSKTSIAIAMVITCASNTDRYDRNSHDGNGDKDVFEHWKWKIWILVCGDRKLRLFILRGNRDTFSILGFRLGVINTLLKLYLLRLHKTRVVVVRLLAFSACMVTCSVFEGSTLHMLDYKERLFSLIHRSAP